MTERDLLIRTAEIAADYLESLDTRGVGPTRTYREMHVALDAPVPDGPSDASAVIEELASLEPGITAMGSGRYFGFVIGGALPHRSRPTGSCRRGTRTPASQSRRPQPPHSRRLPAAG